MVACVHVAKILPGKKDEFCRQVKEGLEANPEALRAFGFQRIVSFVTPETADDSGGLLVTVYEVDDPAVLLSLDRADDLAKLFELYSAD